jgi:tRNA (guanine-N(7)-)-methyltransferase subunit TRM82
LLDIQLDDNSLQHIQTYELPGNPLAVTTGVPLPIQGSVNDLVVSIDTVHRLGSTKELRSEAAKTKRLLGIQLQDNGLVGGDGMFIEPVDEAVYVSHQSDSTGKLNYLLYNLENLRKRDGDGQDE